MSNSWIPQNNYQELLKYQQSAELEVGRVVQQLVAQVALEGDWVVVLIPPQVFGHHQNWGLA